MPRREQILEEITVLQHDCSGSTRTPCKCISLTKPIQNSALPMGDVVEIQGANQCGFRIPEQSVLPGSLVPWVSSIRPSRMRTPHSSVQKGPLAVVRFRPAETNVSSGGPHVAITLRMLCRLESALATSDVALAHRIRCHSLRRAQGRLMGRLNAGINISRGSIVMFETPTAGDSRGPLRELPVVGAWSDRRLETCTPVERLSWVDGDASGMAA